MFSLTLPLQSTPAKDICLRPYLSAVEDGLPNRGESRLPRAVDGENGQAHQPSCSPESLSMSSTAPLRMFPGCHTVWTPSTALSVLSEDGPKWRPLSPIVSSENEDLSLMPADELDVELAALLIQFDLGGDCFPTEMKGAYVELSMAAHRLRLYALAWRSPARDNARPDLFLILQPVQGSRLPANVQLEVREKTLTCTQTQLCWSASPAYLYTQVLGDWQQSVSVEVRFPGQAPRVMPTLQFAR